MSAQQSTFDYLVSMAFGSDDLTPYTAQYTWNSNQMAHAMMGFCLAVCWLTFVVSFGPGRQRVTGGTPGGPQPTFGGRVGRWLSGLPMGVYVLGLFATIPAKEAADYLLDSKRFANAPVRPHLDNLLFDSATDISFWWAGMFLAAAVLALFTKEERGLRFVVPSVGLAVCVLFWVYCAGGVWQNQKQTFDASGMPFNYTRLAVLSGRKDDVMFAPGSPVKWPDLELFRAAVVSAPPDVRPEQRHYVIYGGTPAQRSKLAVSMGCEYAFKLRGNAKYADDEASIRALYVTAAAALERPEALLIADSKLLECVVIDDLDVSTRLPSRVDDEQSFRFYRNTANLRPPTPAAIAPSATKDPPPSPAAPRPTVLIPKKDLDALNRFKKLPITKQASPQGSGLLEVPAAEFDKLAPPPKAVFPLDGPDELREAKEELEARVKVLKAFGAKTKPKGEGDAGISTIWVLAGYPGIRTAAHDAWEKRRKAWVTEIADILDVKENSLYLIELAEPKGAAP